MSRLPPDRIFKRASGRTERTNGQVSMVAGAGHYPHAEMPQSVGPAIVDFLASLAG